VCLSGCIAAALPLAFAGMAASGFMAYKTIQLAGGGSLEIEFPGKDGKTVPPQPLPAFRHVAVWPGDEGDVRFAERLQSSARFSSVVAPAAVSAILADTKTAVDLKQLTEQEKGEAFDRVCQRAKVEFIFASTSQGASENSNSFSFQRANITYTADLLGYSCAQHKIAWRDQMALVIDVAGSVSNTAAMNRAGADAWAERVFQAMGEPVAAPKA
jgi:hypothetical protein